MHYTDERPFREYEGFIPDAKRFYDSLHDPLPRHLRANTLRISAVELTEMLREQGYRVRPTSLPDYLLEPDGPERPAFTLEAMLGYFLFQALTSAIVVMALDPRPS
jgi:16S rRNA C967 or C1407 C5-methylase (RsmB/RsmF family)